MLQIAVFPDLEVAQGQGAEPDADEVDDRVADGIQHTADLPVFALGDGDPEQGMAATLLDKRDFRGQGRAVFKGHAPAQQVQGFIRDHAFDGGLVGPGSLVAGVGEAVGPFAVIGEQQQSHGIEIESAHGIDPLGDVLYQVGHQGSAFRLVQRTDVAERLVDDQVSPLGRPGDLAAVHFDPVAPPDRPRAESRDPPAV